MTDPTPGCSSCWDVHLVGGSPKFEKLLRFPVSTAQRPHVVLLGTRNLPWISFNGELPNRPSDGCGMFCGLGSLRPCCWIFLPINSLNQPKPVGGFKHALSFHRGHSHQPENTAGICSFCRIVQQSTVVSNDPAPSVLIMNLNHKQTCLLTRFFHPLVVYSDSYWSFS